MNLENLVFWTFRLIRIVVLMPVIILPFRFLRFGWRHKFRVALILLILFQGLVWWRHNLIKNDECRGYVENPYHPLRDSVMEILYSCLDGNGRSVRLAYHNGLEAARIEKELTVWYDNDPLVEYLAAKINFLQDHVHTYGPFQVSYVTGQEVYKRYRHNEALNRFLNIDSHEVEELAKTKDISRVIQGLQLRCRGSIILGHLLVHDLWMGLENGTERSREILDIVDQTRQVLVKASGGRKFHDVTDDSTPRRIEAANRWIQGSLNLRLQNRLGIYVMSAYAGGLGGGRDADVQACLNEWLIVFDRANELILVDGDWGKGTEALVTEFLGRPAAEKETREQRRQAVWAKWRADVEPRLSSLLVGVIMSGDPGQLMPLLKNRYVGHVSVYNGLNDMLACPEMNRLSKEGKEASFNQVEAAWDGWTRDRDAGLWRFLTDKPFFEKTFPPVTELYQETLVRMTAQWFLITRLAPRQLHFEVKMIFRETWKSHENLLIRLHKYAGRQGWLIDNPLPPTK